MPTSARTSAVRSTTSRSNGRKPPPATLVLLVRHGTTPTTGKVLPGQAAGLHLAEKGRAQADVGDWTEQRLSRLVKSKEWPAVHRWPSGFRFPGGESFAEMSVRSMEAVLELVAEHPGQTVVAVSHADPIKAIVAAAAGVPLDLMQRITISPCSISALLFGAGGPLVLSVNSTGALDELVPS